MADSITLTVKTANQQVPDFIVECPSSWTVQELKLFLSKNHPQSPQVTSQRLIYGGQLLKNTFNVAEAIRSDDNHRIIHLVCPASECPTELPSKPEIVNINETLRRRHVQQQLQQQQQHQQQQQQQQQMEEPSPQEPPPAGNDPNQQALYQEYLNYLQQYYYQRLWTAAAAAGVAASENPARPPAPPEVAPVGGAAAAGGAAPAAAAPEPLAAGAGMVAANAMGNEADVEGGVALDDQAATLADWLSIAVRTFCVSLIMYYYSSADKAVLSFIIFMLIMVIQAGHLDFIHRWFPRGNAEEVPAAAAPVPVPAQEEQAPAATPDQPSAPQEDPSMTPGPAVLVPGPEDSPIARAVLFIGLVLRTATTFMITFFTSMIPERAPPLNFQ